MKKSKKELLNLMRYQPWSFYYGGSSDFIVKRHEYIDEVGTDIRNVTCPLGWVGIDKYDFTSLDKSFETLLLGHPNRLFVPRLVLHSPRDWCKAHPEDLCVYFEGPRDAETIVNTFDKDFDPDGADGGNKGGPGKFSQASFSSKNWLHDCGEAIRRFVEHVENSKYADQIIGYHFGGAGCCGENMWWGDWRNQGDPRRGDFGINNTKFFREFLINKYGSLDGIRKAWGNSKLVLDDIYEPAPMEYWSEKGVSLKTLLACDNQKLLDTFEFHTDVTINFLEYFAKIIKDASGDKPVGAFYGYLQDETVGYSGHCGIEKILKSPYLDFFSSPKAYHYCLAGDPGASQGPGQSIHRQKLWVEENDSRSYLAMGCDYDRSPKSLPDTITVFWREIFRALTNNFTFWWMDIRGKDDDWYTEPTLLQMLKDQASFFKKWVPVKRESKAEVVFVEDEASCGHMIQCSGVARNARYKLERELRLCGVPVDHLLITDLRDTDCSQYKFIVFCHAFYLPKELWSKIRENINPNATILWNYAPAMLDPDFNPDNQRDITGFTTRECGKRELHPDQYKHIYWHGVHTCKQDYPLLDIVDDGKLEIIQKTPDNFIITAKKKHDGLIHILSVDFALRSKLLKELIDNAGVKSYAPCHVCVLCDSHLIGFFPRYDVEFEYTFPFKFRDVISGKVMDGKQKFKIKGKEFRIFERV